MRQQILHGLSNSTGTSTLAIITGFILRLYQLGHDSLWNDEVIQVKAALQPSISDVLHFVRTLNFSMPLDYLITWSIVRISLSEFVLRLPSVIWGTATLLICFWLFKKISSNNAALLGIWLLSLSPLHIHYSQEVRFYASMVFFYYISTYFLLHAVERPNYKNWLGVGLISIIGAYIHLFVLFSFLNGFAWLLYKRSNRKAISWFIVCVIVVAFSVLPIYLSMEEGQTYNYPLFTTNESFLSAISSGLGLLSIHYAVDLTWGSLFTIFCLALFCIGAIQILSKKSPLTLLFIALAIQILLLIIGAIWVKHPITYRYFIFLHPLALLISSQGCLSICTSQGWGIVRIIRQGEIQSQAKILRQTYWIYVIIIGILLLSTIPALLDYYSWPKSNARSVSELILHKWKSGDMILVAPGYSARIYDYYFRNVYKLDEIASTVMPTEIDRLTSHLTDHHTFLIYTISFANPFVKERNYLDTIKGSGYKPLIISKDEYGFHSLFVSR